MIVKFPFSIPTSDGDWDWYNYSLVVLETSQRRDFKCTCLAAVHFNVWCAIGNMIHVVHSHLLKKEVSLSHSPPPPSLSLPPSLLLSSPPSLPPSPLFMATYLSLSSLPFQCTLLRRLKCLTWYQLVMGYGYHSSLTPPFVSFMALHLRVCKTLTLAHRSKGYWVRSRSYCTCI